MYFIKLKVVPTVFAVTLVVFALSSPANATHICVPGYVDPQGNPTCVHEPHAEQDARVITSDSAALKPAPASSWVIGLRRANLVFDNEGFINDARNVDIPSNILSIRHDFGSGWGIEYRRLTSASKSDIRSTSRGPFYVELKEYAGLFVRYGWKPNPTASPYVLLGTGNTTLELGLGSSSGSATESSVGLGFGINLNASPNLAFSFESTVYYGEEDSDGDYESISGIAFGLEYRF